MGTFKDQAEEQQYRRKARGGTFKKMPHDLKSRPKLDLSQWDPGLFDTLITAVLEHRFYIGLAMTKDGGAISCLVKTPEDDIKTFITKPEEVFACCHDLDIIAEEIERSKVLDTQLGPVAKAAQERMRALPPPF